MDKKPSLLKVTTTTMAGDAARGAGTVSSLIANYVGIASLRTPSTRVEAVYASDRLAIVSGPVYAWSRLV